MVYFILSVVLEGRVMEAKQNKESVDTNNYSFFKCFASRVFSLILIFAVFIKCGGNDGAVCSRCIFLDTPLPERLVVKPQIIPQV